MERGGVIGAIRGRRRRLRGSLLLGVALTAIAVGVGLQASGALKRLELLTVDARFDVRGARAAPDDIVVVGIDDKTFGTLQPTFPFPRGLYAKVIDRDRKSTRLNSSHLRTSRMPSSA